MDWFKKLFKRKSSENYSPITTSIPIYRIKTLTGDTYHVTENDLAFRLGVCIRPALIGGLTNPDIKVITYIPTHRIDWIQENGVIEIT